MRRGLAVIAVLAIWPAVAQASPRSIALERSQAAGEPNPTVVSDRGGIVTLRGHFTLRNTPLPRGFPPPTGTTMTLTVTSGFVTSIKLTGASTTATAASWGGGCAQWNHCYAIVEQEANVVGTLAYQYVTAMNVPGWQSGDFVTDEEWAVWPGRYIEVGLMGGNYRDCCSLFPFAAGVSGAGFFFYEAPWAYPGWTNVLLQLSGQSRNGTWCPYFEGTQVFCMGGFGVYAPTLQVGAETAANTRPSNSGHEGTNAWWPNGSVSNWRNEFAWADRGMCLGRWPYPYPALGNIYFGTC